MPGKRQYFNGLLTPAEDLEDADQIEIRSTTLRVTSFSVRL